VLNQFPREGFLAGITSTVFRKLGQHKRALELADKAYSLQPGDMTAIFQAGAYRALGDVDNAVATFQKALQHNPSRYHIKLDIGDLLCDEGKIKEGLQYYDNVLKVEPQQSWAYPSALYYRFALDENSKWQQELEAYAAAHPENNRATHMLRLFELFKIRQQPYRLYLPEPSEATIAILKQIQDMPGDKLNKPGSADNVFKIGLSSLEAPSSRLALETFLEPVMHF